MNYQIVIQFFFKKPLEYQYQKLPLKLRGLQ